MPQSGPRHDNTRTTAPNTDEEQSEEGVAWLDAASLARGYRDGSITPTEVAEVLLARIERLNPSLNAFATVLPDLVLEQAERASRELASGLDRGPLHGVPVGVKDLMDVEGWPTRFGSTVAPVLSAVNDAAVVARLRRSGTVIVGKTQLLEYAYGAVHPDVGPTWNPWNNARTAGGSSGGSAAALAAGLVPLTLGTDTGGSIRIPAAYCGVFGLKPTFGRLPLAGVFPLSWSLDGVGPMARTMPDLLALFDVLDDSHGGSRAILDGRRFGVPEDYVAQTDVAPDINDLFRNVLEQLRRAGAEVDEVSFQPMAEANRILVEILRPEATVIHEQNMRDLETADAESPAYSEATFAQLRGGFDVPATTYIAAIRRQARLKAEFAKLMAGYDGLLMPSVGFVAPEEDPAADNPAGAAEMHFSGPFNVLGVPALSLPIGLADGLPGGLQLVTAEGEDRLAIALATAIESCLQVQEHERRPTGY